MQDLTAIEFVRCLKYIPASKEGAKLGRPSNSELKRWFSKGCIWINGKQSTAKDEIEFPITSLVFFKGNKRAQCTMM